MRANIRRATLDDQDQIAQFLQAAYKDRVQYKYPERWRWEFLDNPYWDGEGLPILVAEVDDKIVGQLAEMVVPLKVGDNVYRVPWGVDFIVLPEYRGRWIGALLLKAIRANNDICIGLSMAPVTRRMAELLRGYKTEGGVELSRILSFAPDEALAVVEARLGETSGLARLARRLHLGGIAAVALNLRLRLRDAKRLRTGDSNLVIEQIERFGDESDQLWARLASHFPIIVQRDATYLNWKFVEQPHVQYDKFVAKQGGEVRGYVIARRSVPPEPNRGIIADVFAAPDDDIVLQALLAHAVKHLRRVGANNIIAATSVPGYAFHFLRLGFKETQQVVPMFNCKEPAENDLASDPRNWFLSMGDHDWDQYPLL